MVCRLYSAVWNKFCRLQKWFEEAPKAICKMVQEFSQKILDFYVPNGSINDVMKHINQV